MEQLTSLSTKFSTHFQCTLLTSISVQPSSARRRSERCVTSSTAVIVSNVLLSVAELYDRIELHAAKIIHLEQELGDVDEEIALLREDLQNA